MKSLVKLDDVVRVYGKGSTQVQALRGIDLEVVEGEFSVVMGPSGSGKTTLLNVIGGMDTPTAGVIQVDSRTINDFTEAELDDYRLNRVGFVFQTYNLIPSLSAQKNVELPMLAAGKSTKEATKRASELLSIVGLSKRKSHRPHELSGGECQRVAIATALSNDPPLILADEPTGNLDSTTASSIVDYLWSVSKEYNKTIILVTHDDSIARRADWINVIKDGKIVSKIRPSQLDKSITSHEGFLTARIAQIEKEILQLDAALRAGDLESTAYLTQRGDLEKKIDVLRDELLRLGQV